MHGNKNDGYGQFTFNGAFFASAWDEEIIINLSGYDINYHLVYDLDITLLRSQKKWVQAEFKDITHLSIRNLTHSNQIAFDNWTYTESPIPEPSILALMGIGLMGFFCVNHRKV